MAKGREMRPFIALRVGVAVTAVFMSGESVRADKWASPRPTTVTSPSGDWTAEMTPAWGEVKQARVTVRPKGAAVREKGWDRAPLNRVAPADLFVSDRGALLTVGDWHNEGGRNAVVIYNHVGEVVVDYTLESFLTEAELKRVKRTVSSRWWRYTSEAPESRDEAFLITTSWGQVLRFDLRTGKVSREGRRFERFRAYCEGTRKAREAVIYVSNVWRQGDRYTGRHCELRRGASRCQVGGERFREEDARPALPVSPQDFDKLIRGAGEMAGQIVDDGVYEFDQAFLHVQIAFGDAIRMSRFGAPEGGDLYWLRYRPADLKAASALEWTKRLEALLPPR